MSDLISRQAAIDALDVLCQEHRYRIPGKRETYSQYNEAWQDALDRAEVAIGNLPSAQPERKKSDWIPVERELPNGLEEVNVTWVNHEPEPYYESIKSKPFTASAVFYEGKWYWYSSVCADVLGEYGRNDVDKVDDTIEITAWRPLPEPYRGGDVE